MKPVLLCILFLILGVQLSTPLRRGHTQGSATRSTTWAPIRVHFDVSNLNPSAETSYLANVILPQVKSRVASLLQVYSVIGNLEYPRFTDWCDVWLTFGVNCSVAHPLQLGPNLTIPSSDLTPKTLCNLTHCHEEGGGIPNVDFAAYVYSNPEECRPSTLALAGQIVIDIVTGQPLFCRINLCDLGTVNRENDDVVALFVHEIYHGLGFLGFDQVGPHTTQTVRDLFKCPTLNVPFDFVFETGGSHTSPTFFHRDVMNPHIHDTTLYSNISLAILHDTGWYDPIYENADPIVSVVIECFEDDVILRDMAILTLFVFGGVVLVLILIIVLIIRFFIALDRRRRVTDKDQERLLQDIYV